jgi:hypothetical protein
MVFSIDRLLATTDADELRNLIKDYADLNPDELEDLVGALLKPGRGKPTAVPRLRRRASFDENYEETIDGFKVKFTDLLDNNTEGLIGSYIQQMSGQIALARNGIKSVQDYSKIIKQVKDSYEIPEIAKEYTGFLGNARKELELNTIDTIYKNIVGIPTEKNITGAVSTALRNLRKYNYVNVFNQVGFAQIPEMGNIVATAGVRGMIKYIPEFKNIITRAKSGKLSNELLDEIETVVSGTGSNRLIDSTINRTDDFAGATTRVGKVEKTLDIASRITADFSGFHAVDTLSRRLAAITAFDKLAMHATGKYKVTKGVLNRYRNIGFSDDELQAVFKNIRENSTFIEGGLTGRKIRRLNIDNWDDQDLVNKMSLYMSRHLRRVIQENNYGEMLAIGTDSGLGKTMLQFRNFVITAYSKQLLHGFHMRDFTALAGAMSSAFIASLVFVAQTHVQALGKSGSEKEDFLEKRLSIGSIGKAAFQRSTYASLLPVFYDTLASPFGAEPMFNYRTSGLEINLITGNPTYNLLFDKGFGAIKSIGTALADDEYDFSKQSAYKIKVIEYRSIMTISSTTVRNSYSGDGTTDTFTYNFKIFQDSDIQVIIRSANGTETIKTITTHYTVTDAGVSAGGTVVFTAGNIPTATETVVLRRNIPQTQAIDYIANDPFPAESHEEGLDRATMAIQQIQEEVTRSLKLSKTNTMTSTEFTVGAADRANKILAFDAAGEISVTQELGTYKGTDTTITTEAYVQRDIVKSTSATQLNNVYICVGDSVVGDLLTDTDHFDLLVDAVSAAASATAAASSATDAETAQTAAETAQTAAELAETNAETAETNAETAETNAAASEANAATSETNAAASEAAAATSETNAATSETNAATSESNASTSASTATTQAGIATTQAGIATTQAGNASTSASNASTSESNAATSESNAATSESNAAASAAAAATAADNFDDVYLGSKASDPTLDNDGDALTAGDLYYNSVGTVLKYYTGSAWVSITSGGITDVVQDTTPQLGGNLDINTYSIVSTSDGNINITPNGTGKVVLDGISYPDTDGTDGQFIKTDGSGVLSFGAMTLSYSSGTATGDGTEDEFTISSGRAVNDILVFVNGFQLTPTTDYTISGTTLTFQTAPANNAEITFRYLPLGGAYTHANFTGDGSATTITIDAGRAVDDILVVVNGLTLVPTDDYTISGTTLTFATAPANLAEITVRYLRLS